MINSRKLEDLDAEPRRVCQAMIEGCRAAAGIELLITSTYRDGESQSALWALGRTVDITRPRVTEAKAGQSWHNYRCAWDVVPLVHGKPLWSPTDPIWTKILQIAKAVGASRGPQWELAHFQVVPEGLIDHKGQPTMAALERFHENGTLFVV